MKRTISDSVRTDDDIFLELVPYVGAVPKTKEQLRVAFESFLNNPEHGGCFYVYWKENDNYENTDSVEKTFNDVVRYMKK